MKREERGGGEGELDRGAGGGDGKGEGCGLDRMALDTWTWVLVYSGEAGLSRVKLDLRCVKHVDRASKVNPLRWRCDPLHWTIV